MNAGTYEVVNVRNGHRYIGLTTNFRRRRNGHWEHLRQGKSKHPILQKAWNKYGGGAFVFRKLLICAPIKEQLEMYEQLCFDHLKPEYNSLRVSGSSTGTVQSPESIAKRVAKLKGRTLTAEHRRNISVGQTGRKLPPEWVANMAAAQRGKKRSPEARKNMSLARAGRVFGPLSPAHRAACVEAQQRRRAKERAAA